jgi:outer membrane protein assembly factor BamE
MFQCRVRVYRGSAKSLKTLPVQCKHHIVAAFPMFDSIVRCVFLGALGAAGVMLSGCSTVNNASNRVASIVKPYKIDIVQGNFVSSEQLAALKEGMPRSQVKNILGTPLLTDIFHADRWDYVFTFKRQGVEPQARKVTVYFKDDLVTRIEADALPSEAEFVASLDSGRKPGPVPVLEMSPESLKASAPTVKTTPAEPAKPVALPPASYPPLESPAP